MYSLSLAGAFEFACLIPDRRWSGMHGIIAVERRLNFQPSSENRRIP